MDYGRCKTTCSSTQLDFPLIELLRRPPDCFRLVNSFVAKIFKNASYLHDMAWLRVFPVLARSKRQYIRKEMPSIHTSWLVLAVLFNVRYHFHVLYSMLACFEKHSCERKQFPMRISFCVACLPSSPRGGGRY